VGFTAVAMQTRWVTTDQSVFKLDFAHFGPIPSPSGLDFFVFILTDVVVLVVVGVLAVIEGRWAGILSPGTAN
jgi:hypothetical protein